MRSKRAQSILEYTIIIAIVGAALFAMQLYFRRSIQAVVKLAADEVGEQKKGMLEYDYENEWKLKGSSEVTTTSDGTDTTKELETGAIAYEKDQATQRAGILSRGIYKTD